MTNCKFLNAILVVAITATLIMPNKSDAAIFMAREWHGSRNDYGNRKGEAGILALFAGVGALASMTAGGEMLFDSWFPKEGEDTESEKQRRRNRAEGWLYLIGGLGLLVLDEEPVVTVQGARHSTFSMEVLSMIYPEENAAIIAKDLALLDSHDLEPQVMKFQYPDEIKLKIQGKCQKECEEKLPEVEKQFLKESTDKLSELATRIKKASYTLSTLTTRHIIETVSGYTFEN